MVEHTNPFPEEQGNTSAENPSAETAPAVPADTAAESPHPPAKTESAPIHKSGEFQLHIPEEELQFGDEDSIQSYSDSFQKKEEPKKQKPVDRKQCRKEKKDAKKRDKVKGRKNRWLFRCVWIAMVVLVSIALSRFLLVGVDDMLAISRSANASVSVEIKDESTPAQVADELVRSGAIKNSFFFRMYCLVTGVNGNFGQGSYQLDGNMDYEAIVNYLQNNSNRLDVVTVTFPEGLSLLEIAEKLEENEVCTVEEVLEAANSDEFDNYDFINAITNADERYYKLEGYLFPDTYDFYKGEEPKVALGKMINNCQNRFSKEMREKVEEGEYSIDQILTLASIVQAEATDEKDMRMIAGILLNRLTNGASHDIYRLECDSTTYYPYRSLSQVPEDERDTFKSTYDTYSIQGLPPGPICSPGLDAIKAVLEPSSESSGMYYFCHDEDGNPYYASTASEHQANLKAAGITE